MESCDIYIISVRYDGIGWINNPDDLLQSIYNNFCEIPDFYFVSLSLNMSQVYNVNLKQSNYEAMILYIKGIKYQHSEFLTLDQVKDLESKIKQQLNYIEKLSYGEIEVRSSIVYRDIDLGIAGTTHVVKAPQVIESH